MLRNLALALLGMSVLAGPAAARGDGPSGGRRGDAKVSVGADAVRPSPLLRRAMATTVRPVAMPASVVRASCGGRAASGCRGHHHHAASLGGGWARGLPPALGVQAQECPSGTMATLAEGHDDVVRCIPM